MAVSPKDILRQIAQAQDTLMEAATRPIRDLASTIASTLGLPEPPAPPKAADFVEALPDLPAPQAFIPTLPAFPAPGAQKQEVEKIKATTTVTTTSAKLKVA